VYQLTNVARAYKRQTAYSEALFVYFLGLYNQTWVGTLKWATATSTFITGYC